MVPFDDQFERRTDVQDVDSAADEAGAENERKFKASVEKKWTALKNRLAEEAHEYDRTGLDAGFVEISAAQCRVENAAAGLAVTVTSGTSALTIQYTFEATKKDVAAPEGGFFSFHRVNRVEAELHSADERISIDTARRMLLEPLLFPRLPGKAA